MFHCIETYFECSSGTKFQPWSRPYALGFFSSFFFFFFFHLLNWAYDFSRSERFSNHFQIEDVINKGWINKSWFNKEAWIRPSHIWTKVIVSDHFQGLSKWKAAATCLPKWKKCFLNHSFVLRRMHEDWIDSIGGGFAREHTLVARLQFILKCIQNHFFSSSPEISIDFLFSLIRSIFIGFAIALASLHLYNIRRYTIDIL